MSDEDIRNYLAGKSNHSASKAPKALKYVRKRAVPEPAEPETFKDFSATHLFCPQCKSATPVRERLLLFLPDGDLYDYVCSQCGTSVGTRKAGK